MMNNQLDNSDPGTLGVYKKLMEECIRKCIREDFELEPQPRYVKYFNAGHALDLLEDLKHPTGRNGRMASERNLGHFNRDNTPRESDAGAMTASGGISDRKIAIVSALNTLDHGNLIWIKKWVDYSNKYGIGYLISNGCTGVYFNDSSKIISWNDGFYYISRKGNSQEETTEIFSFKKFPDNLKKKVILLEHFKKHLDDGRTANCKAEDLVYIKKWISTEYAIIFRLNNKVVQIKFLDKTEMLLCYSLTLNTNYI